MNIGVDYSSGSLTAEQCHANDIAFVFRYVSNPDNPKNLQPHEVTDFRNGNIGVGIYFETTANRALQGEAAGHADALSALAQARELLGTTDHEYVCFTVDTDTSPENVAAYFRGACNAIGVQRVGSYGDVAVVKYLKENGLCSFTVQTRAWSHHEWWDGDDIRQDEYQTIDGVQCDILHPQTENLGLWGVAHMDTPKPTIPDNPADWTAEVIKMLPTIKNGAHGQVVKNLQALLNAHGATLTVDGMFGPHTEDAVKHFQQEKGLAVDGIVGQNTWTSAVEK